MGMDVANQFPAAGRKHRSASLRRSRVTTITCSAPGDRVTAQWNPDKREWQVFTESSNGLRIENKRLTAD
jgi:hypothetical protein